MSSNYFRVKSIIDLEKVKQDDKIYESDFSIVTKDNKFIQYDYLEEEEKKLEPYTVKPGIWAIQKGIASLYLAQTSFNVDKLLDTHSFTQEICEKVDIFFSKFDVYRKKNRVPIRKFLLFGPPGSGKTSSLIKVIDKYVKDEKTAVVVWHTDKFESHQVKDFIQSFEYPVVEKLILVVEDIGGFELDEHKLRSDSSLLSLLDNKESTFKIPTLLFATTNHPETLLGNLTNRPGRFTDKIEVGYPKAKERIDLFKFYLNRELTLEEENVIKSNFAEDFTPDHINSVIDNAELYDQTLVDAIKIMKNEIEKYKKAFGKDKTMGIRDDFYDQ